MQSKRRDVAGRWVALLAEGVDRNVNVLDPKKHKKVALLAEGVDRNWANASTLGRAYSVALLAEGVDRNDGPLQILSLGLQSPSSRRAWIEIECRRCLPG